MLDETFLSEAIEKFASSPDGKKQIKKKYGVDYDKNSKGMSQADLMAYAEKAKRILYSHIVSQVPGIMFHNIKINQPVVNKDGTTTVVLSLRDVQRESLQPKRHWRGIEDIVLHFARGWSARYRIWGTWHGQEVGSRQRRESHPFILRALKEIKNELGEVAEVTLLGDYANLN